ncbi:hypothetical protein [Costertonia aggregata]|nr:hypothetical protein [Costertonia aggregata]
MQKPNLTEAQNAGKYIIALERYINFLERQLEFALNVETMAA